MCVGLGAGDDREERLDEVLRAEFENVLQEGLAVRPPLAPDLRPLSVGEAVERLLDLRLQERPLVLDDDELLLAAGEADEAVGLERPGHRHLVDGDAHRPRPLLVDAEEGERLHEVAVRLAGRDEADPRPLLTEGDPVETVRLHVRLHGGKADVAQEPLGLEAIAQEELAVDVVLPPRIGSLGEHERQAVAVDGD